MLVVKLYDFMLLLNHMCFYLFIFKPCVFIYMELFQLNQIIKILCFLYSNVLSGLYNILFSLNIIILSKKYHRSVQNNIEACVSERKEKCLNL